MAQEIPKYALRAYALLHTKYGTKEEFSQDSLNWIVSFPMRKKIFSVLLNSGWIIKRSKRRYCCVEPKSIFNSLFFFKVPDILKRSERAYCYSKMSAVEIWTNFAYIQRSWEHSPYFVKVKESDLDYWKKFLSKEGVPFFIGNGTFIGEFVILKPTKRLRCSKYNSFQVEDLAKVIEFCQNNSLFEYPLAYLKKKFNLKISVKKELLKEVEVIL